MNTPYMICILLLAVTPNGFAADTSGTTTVIESSSLLKFNGSLRLRTETSDKTDVVSNRSYTSLRVRPALTFTPDPRATLVFEPQFAKVFGEPVFVGSTTTANASQTTSSATYDTPLSVHEAYVNLSPADWNHTLIGRQILSYGDELIIGAAEWTLIGRSFDALKSRFSYSSGWTDLLASKLLDNNTTATPGTGDLDLYGVYNSWNFGESFKAVDLYGLYQRDATGLRLSNLYNLGVRARSTVGAADYRVEIDKQWQFINAVDGLAGQGFQADGELGYVVAKEHNVRLGVEGFYADKDYNQLYPTGHKWLGIADVFGRRNIAGFALHASAQVLEELKLMLDFHHFLRTDTTAPAFKLNGTAAIGSGIKSGSNQLANEVDLAGAYKISNKLTAALGAAVVVPGAYLKDQLSLGNVLDFYYVELQIVY